MGSIEPSSRFRMDSREGGLGPGTTTDGRPEDSDGADLVLPFDRGFPFSANSSHNLQDARRDLRWKNAMSGPLALSASANRDSI